MKLAIIDVFRLGDQVYTAALVHALRRRHPEWTFTCVASTATAGAGLLNGLADVHYFDFPWLQPGWQRRPLGLLRACRSVGAAFAAAHFDLVIGPRGGGLERLVGARLRAQRKIFFTGHRAAGLKAAWFGYQTAHVFRCREELGGLVAATTGSEGGPLDWPFLSPSPDPVSAHRTVGFAPEASMPGKCWPVESWHALRTQLQRRGDRVVLIVDRWRDRPDLIRGFDAVFSGSVDALRRQLSGCRLIVAVDSFVGHCAAAIGVPVVSLFGPTDPEIWRPWGPLNRVVAPSGRFPHAAGRTNYDKYGAHFMTRIETDAVLAAIDAVPRTVTPTP